MAPPQKKGLTILMLLWLTCLYVPQCPKMTTTHPRRRRIDARILIVGDPRVGKSATFRSLMNIPKEEVLNTIRTFSHDIVTIRYEYPDGRYMVLEVIDIAGDMDAAPLVRSYYANIDAVLLMCDVTRPATLQSLHERWLPDIDRWRTGYAKKAHYLLIGNKCDKPDSEKLIAEHDMVAFCKEHRIRWYTLSSAKTWSWATHPNPIEKFFLRVVAEVLMRPPPPPDTHARDHIRLYRADQEDEDEEATFKDKAADELRNNCILCDQ